VPLPGGGGGGVPLPGGGGGGSPPGAAASLSDIFGDPAADGGGPGTESTPAHPFHGDNSFLGANPGAAPDGGAPAGGGDGLLDFIQAGGGGGSPTGAAKEQLYRIRKRSGQVLGPYDENTVLGMIDQQQLAGNEEVSTDGTNWRSVGQVPAFKEAIARAMAAALSGLDAELPGLTGTDAPLPGLTGQDAPLPGLTGQDAPLPGVPGAPGGAPGADGLQNQFATASSSQLHPAIIAKRKRRRMIRIAAAAVILLVLAAGGSLHFLTDWGAFGYAKIIELVKGGPAEDDKPTDAPPPPPELPTSDVPPAELLARDTYTAFRQGAELQARIVDAGRKLEKMPPEANKAAAEEARFLAYLLVLEEMSFFEKKLSEAVTLATPGDVGKVLGEVALAYHAGRWDDGLTLVTPFANPDRGLKKGALSEMFVWKGIGHKGKGELGEAQKAFDQALQHSLDNLTALSLQAIVLLEAKENESALAYADKALEVSRSHPRANLTRGRILLLDPKTRNDGRTLLSALATGDLGKEAAPLQRAKALTALADVDIDELSWDTALQHMNAAVDAVPANREVRLRHGDLALKLREFGLASQSFAKLVELDAKDPAAIIGLARSKIGSRDALGGYSDLQAALAEKADDPKLHFWFGIAALELLKREGAVASFSKARELDPEWAEPAAQLVLDRINLGKLKKALEMASRAEGQVAPEQRHRIRAVKSEIFVRQRNYALAEKELQSALKEAPGDVDARVRYVQFLVGRNRIDDATTNADEAKKYEPKNPRVIAGLGLVMAAGGDHRKALEQFDEASSVDPNDHSSICSPPARPSSCGTTGAPSPTWTRRDSCSRATPTS
jgi:tetratricopeptide (TPR) repeat protein